MAITISGTNGIVGAGFTVDNSGVSVTAGVGTFGTLAAPAAGLTGALPALNAASLTSIPAANIVGVCTSGLTKTGGFGKVVQFVQAQSSTSVETTSGSYQTFSQLQLSITPTSATNLLFAQLSIPVVVYEQSGSDSNSVVALTDDNGSSYFFETINRIYDYGGSGGYINWIAGGQTVNTAGSTSSRTYKVRFKLTTGDKITINAGGSGLSILTIMEIEP
tara:strand:+ start:148 stop:804 length:657 start_codon:yes stop_codon:yes gene_type:complete